MPPKDQQPPEAVFLTADLKEVQTQQLPVLLGLGLKENIVLSGFRVVYFFHCKSLFSNPDLCTCISVFFLFYFLEDSAVCIFNKRFVILSGSMLKIYKRKRSNECRKKLQNEVSRNLSNLFTECLI